MFIFFKIQNTSCFSVLLVLSLMIWEPAKALLGKEETTCETECTGFLPPSARSYCDDCANSAPLDARYCIYACSNTASWLWANVCYRCENNPPLSASMCIYACKHRDDSLAFENICMECEKWSKRRRG